jgi:uncharacterized protein
MVKKLASIAIAYLLAGLPVSAMAQTSVSLPLGPGEVLVRLQAAGKDSKLADKISIGCTVSASGDDQKAARKDLSDKMSKVSAALKSSGIKEDAIFAVPNWQGKASMVASAMAVAVAADGDDSDGEITEQQEYKIRLSTVDQIGKISDAMTGASCARTSGPDFELADKAAAKVRATDAAMSEAKKSAELYATRLGLKVLRVTRVEEGGGPFSDMMGPEFQQMMAMAMSKIGSSSDEDPRLVNTSQSIVVEFLMGPK